MQHSLKARTISTLRWLMNNGPQAQASAAPDVARECLAKGWAKAVPITSPYPADRGRAIAHLQITPAGRDFIGGD